MLITPWCVATSPNYVEVFVRGAVDTPVYSTFYIRNGVTGAQTAHTASCSESMYDGGWCPGVATVFTQGTSVDTSVTSKPTLILAYRCTVWTVAGCSVGSWMQQAATIAARQ
jgi:hypothetical protein